MKHTVRTADQLAKVIQGIRKSSGQSQQVVADKVGMFQKTVSLLETNPDNASLGSLFKLMSALNLELILQDKSISSNEQETW